MRQTASGAIAPPRRRPFLPLRFTMFASLRWQTDHPMSDAAPSPTDFLGADADEGDILQALLVNWNS